MADKAYLLNDEEMRNFIVNGYVMVKADFPAGFHETIYQKTKTAFEKEGNPGNNLLPRIPEIQEVFNHPAVRGALTSVLGPNYIMHSHRHPHYNPPGSTGQNFHKDSYWGYQKVRHHRPWWAMALYYPQDVTEENGPTAILPGTQYLMTRTHDDSEVELPLFGEAGTVTIIHFDLWHRAMPNRSLNPRYMMKFQFTRMENPQRPTWNVENPMWMPIENGASPQHQVMWRHLWNWSSGKGALLEKTASPSANGNVSQWIKALGDEDASVRLNAADELGLIPESAQDAIPALRGALGDVLEPVGLNAAYALGAIGAPAVPMLIEALGDASDSVRLNAAYGLGAVGTPAVPMLIEALGDASEPARRYAAYALAQMGQSAQDAVPALIVALGDASEPVRRNATDALGTMGQLAQDAVPALIETVLRDKDGQVRFDAALALARMGQPAHDAVPALIKALKDENRYVRDHAVVALHRIGTPEAQDALFHYLLTARWCPSTTKESTF
ncbi:HEAT repeat domain-containing protein [Candidatus Poribacteria bacterium]|nr:HEAT repeat domain-containing protein [Candidatus Poribacteria bacterium]